MIIKCNECDMPISDKAISCPHCGFPMGSGTTITKTQEVPRKKNRRRKLPNGFGQISEVKDKNLRNPYRVMITVGKTDTGKPISKPLKPKGYFRTYNEAYEALVRYHKNPYSIDVDGLTMKDLYEKWTDHYFETLSSVGGQRAIRSAWGYCQPIHDSLVSQINTGVLKECIGHASRIDNDGNVIKASANTKVKMKSMFNLMFDYALEFEIVTRNPARAFEVSKNLTKLVEKEKRDHISFSDEEMQILWNHKNDGYVDILLIQCYSGWRPQELGLLRIEDIDMENDIMIGGMKTEAGENRVVPIHPKIKALVARRYEEARSINSEYLFNAVEGQTHHKRWKLTYEKYQYRFKKIIAEYNLNPEHRAHDGRKQFITMAKRHGVDEYAIKYIVGHRISDLTERVYTDRDSAWLKAEICKIM